MGFNTRRLQVSLGLVALGGTLVLAGCGDDDESSEPVAFCTDYVAAQTQIMLMNTPGGDAEAMQAAVATAQASAPEEVSGDLQTMVDSAATEGDVEGFTEAENNVVGWLEDNCGFGSLSASGVDYQYNDMPEEVEAAVTAVEFTNDGTEFHEAIFIRPADGVTESVEEILALPEEEGLAKLEIVGGVSPIPPGETAKALVDLTNPGDYSVICFLPVGATPEVFADAEAGGPEPEGPPHFTQGMISNLTSN